MLKGKLRHSIDGQFRCNQRLCRKTEFLLQIHIIMCKSQNIHRAANYTPPCLGLKVTVIVNKCKTEEKCLYRIFNVLHTKIDMQILLCGFKTWKIRTTLLRSMKRTFVLGAIVVGKCLQARLLAVSVVQKNKLQLKL